MLSLTPRLLCFRGKSRGRSQSRLVKQVVQSHNTQLVGEFLLYGNRKFAYVIAFVEIPPLEPRVKEYLKVTSLCVNVTSLSLGRAWTSVSRVTPGWRSSSLSSVGGILFRMLTAEMFGLSL